MADDHILMFDADVSFCFDEDWVTLLKVFYLFQMRMLMMVVLKVARMRLR